MRRLTLLGTVSGLALGLALGPGLAFGQGRPGGGGGAPAPSPGSPGGAPNTPTSPSPTRPTQPPIGQQPQMPEIQRNIFLSGKVVMDDGTPPPEPVVVERVCNGMPRPEGYTDSKGRFSIQLGQNRGMIADASVSGMGGFGDTPRTGGGNVDMRGGGLEGPRGSETMGCELRASLAGFRSDVIQLTGRRALDNPDVGTIILHRLTNVQGTTISATSLSAPKDAKKAFEKGVQALQKNKFADAQKQLEKAVEVYPKYAAAWYRLGNAHQGQGNVAEARKAYARALEADSRFMDPYRQLAVLAMKDKNWQDAADTTDRLLRLDPVDYADAYYINSIANTNLRKYDAAEKSAREALRLDSRHQNPRIEYVLGIILANKQDYTGAVQLLQGYLEHAPNASDATTVRNQLVQLQKSAAAQKPQ